MPEEGIRMMNHCDILSFEEIIEVARVAVTLGIDKFRITGGEPLVRKDIVKLIAQLSSIAGVRDLSLTTNGIFLAELAQPLKHAGLHRVNISLDTLDPQKFREITRGGDINAVFRGITAARDAGIKPIKINCVVFKSSKEQDATEVKEFGRLNGLDVRFIRQMNLESGEFSVVEGGNGGNCHQCNRLRLTANGMVKPCLFDEQEFSVREFGAEKALLSALNCKPLNGCFNTKGSFYNIGG
jgi:cyclic pyranopterin phosphate synthase